jgi:hypothetical protein
MGDEPFACGHTDQDLTILVETHDRRCQILPKCVGHDLRLAVFPNRNQAVGGAEVDADDHEMRAQRLTNLAGSRSEFRAEL